MPLARRFLLALSPVLLVGLASFGLNVFQQAAAPAPQDPPHVLPTPYPDRVVLTWSGDPATSQNVNWRTDSTVAAGFAEVALADAAPQFWRTARRVQAQTERVDTRHIEGESVVAHYHAAAFEGLLPDTLYAYRVGDGERWSEWFHFRTASAEPEPFSFVYLGDAQNDILSLWSRTIRAGYAKAPEARFMIHAGDLVNDGHNNVQWGEWFAVSSFIHSMIPSVPVPGNHEYRPYTEAEGEQRVRHLSVHWRPQFTLPENGVDGLEESNYVLDYQGLRILGLNSNERREEQAAWMDSVLADNPNRWTIATFHHPVFSSARERDNEELRAAWKPVFDRHGVDLVLQGHDHSYARGHTYATVENVTNGVNVRDGVTGTVYVVSVSGPKMYTLKADRWSQYEAELEKEGENTQLFQVLHLSGDTLRYEAFTVTGQLYDAFDLIKQADGPNRFAERMPSQGTVRLFTNTLPYDR